MNWFTSAQCSVVGVSNNPTVKLNASSSLGVDHASTEEDLSGLIVEHDDGEVGERWDGEVREGNHARSEQEIAKSDVGEDCNEGGLEEEGEVGSIVPHSLL